MLHSSEQNCLTFGFLCPFNQLDKLPSIKHNMRYIELSVENGNFFFMIDRKIEITRILNIKIYEAPTIYM
jgi:hypothetical protein